MLTRGHLPSRLFWTGWPALAFSGVRGVGDVSAGYETLITPAGYVFAVRGLIYVLLVSLLMLTLRLFLYLRPQNHVLRMVPELATE